jgi:hypothetical protein
MTFAPAVLSERFTLWREGAPCISLGLELVVLADRPVLELRDVYREFYMDFVDLFGPNIAWWSDADLPEIKPAGPHTLRLLPEWLQSQLPQTAGLFGIHLQAGATSSAAVAPQLDFYCHELNPRQPRSGMRFVFPLQTPLGDVERAARWLAERFPLIYGFCGFAFVWLPEADGAIDTFHEWAVPRLIRHPGIGSGDFLLHVLHARSGVLSIGWLTLLGTDFVTRLGGIDALRTQLDHVEVEGFETSGTALIKLGTTPETGDVNRRETLPAYRRLGEVLRPVRIPDELIETINIMVMQGEQKRAWLRRFFGDTTQDLHDW